MLPSSRYQPDVTADFVRLYAANNQRIYRLLRAMIRNSADVDEAFQNTCEALWTKFQQYEPGTNFLAWASSVARYEALRLLRTRGKEARLFSEAFYEAVADEAIELSDVLDRQRIALDECIALLKPRQKQVLSLRYTENGSTQSIADRLSLSANAVYKLLQRTHEALFRCIRKKTL
jgi:RNA polymerase sigma-70 factor (ECF subfamily)